MRRERTPPNSHMGPRGPKCCRVGCGDGYRPLRIHPDPAADDCPGPAHRTGRGSPRHRELRRIPRGSAGRHRLTAAGPVCRGVAHVAGRIGHHIGGNAAAVQHNWLADPPDSCRIHQRSGVRDRRQLDAGSSARSFTTSAGLGLRWRRPRHCVVGCVCTGDARHRGLAGRVVDSGGTGRGPQYWRLGDVRNIPARCRCRATPSAGIVATHEPLVRRAIRELHAGGDRVHHRRHLPGRGHQAEFAGLAEQRRVALRRFGRDTVGCIVGVAKCAVVPSDSACRGVVFAGRRDRTACHGRRCDCSSGRRHPLRGDLHRGQHDGPGGRTPAWISRRGRAADYRVLRRSDPRAGGGDTSSAPWISARAARGGTDRLVFGARRRSSSVRTSGDR